MLKWIGILLVVLTCLLIGNRQSATLRERVRIWEQSVRLAQLLESRIRYTSRPIPPLLKELYRTGDLSALGFLEQITDCPPERFPAEWQKQIAGLPALTESDRELLAAFGAPLGRTDLNGQTTHCRSYAKLFEERRTVAAGELAEKGRLYPVIGLLGGLALALLLV